MRRPRVTVTLVLRVCSRYGRRGYDIGADTLCVSGVGCTAKLEIARRCA